LLMLKKGTHPTELADLYGARFVVCTETEEGRRLAESLVKYITGRERIKARRMREDFWEFAPTHNVFMGTNHRPDVRGTDHAIWRRLKLIPFDLTIPEAEQDKTLPETLRSELPGILAWIVRGCIEYLRDGLGEPEQGVVRPEAWCKFANLYSAYTRWCEESNEYPIKKRRFADRLTERGYERDVGTDGVKIRRGIALHHDGDPDPSRITDPAPDTDPDSHGSAPDLEEIGNPGDDELPIGNSQKTCKSGGVDDRLTDHYRESYINNSNLPYKGLYEKVGNDQSFGNFEGDSPAQTSGSDPTEGLTNEQAQRVI
jgi:phage/plasmid-associated DNA primase